MVLQWVATLLDPSRSNEDRHAALTALEKHGELALLGAAGLNCRRLQVSTQGSNGQTTLTFERGRGPILRQLADSGPFATTITIVSPQLDRRQIGHWLRSVARFAHIPVLVDGTPVAHGLDDVIARGQLRPPFRGVVAVPRDGETARVWLLEHGVVTGHVTVPEAPAFEAAVELGSEATDLNPARLRDQVSQSVKELVDQAAALVVEIGPRVRELALADRTQIARFVLEAVHRGVRADQIATVPVFRVAHADGMHWESLQGLRTIAIPDPSGVRVLTSIFPGQRPDRFALGHTPALIADATERSRIAELLGVRFRPPARRETDGTALVLIRRAIDSGRRALTRALARLFHLRSGRVLDDAQLGPPELEFLEHLRTHLVGDSKAGLHGIRLCEGAGPARLSSGPLAELRLPRHNPTVLAAVRAVNADPAWVYPVALALLDGHELPPPRIRAMWLVAGRRPPRG